MVPSARGRSNRWLGVVLASSFIACGGADLTLPADALPASLTAVSGSGQQGVVGTELPDPLVVRVTDAAGRPVEKASLLFETRVPAARILSATEIRTNQSGQAEVRVRLGATEGTQAFDAQMPGVSNLRATFTVVAVAAPDEGGGGNQGDGGDQAGGGGDDHGNGSGGNGNGGNSQGNGAGRDKDSGGGHGGDGQGKGAGRDHEHGNHDGDDHGHGHGHGHNGEKEKD